VNEFRLEVGVSSLLVLEQASAADGGALEIYIIDPCDGALVSVCLNDEQSKQLTDWLIMLRGI